MKILKQILLLLCCMLLGACSRQEHILYPSMDYADGIRIRNERGYTVVDVLDTWHKGQILQRYVLVPRDSVMPENLPTGTLVRTPLRSVVVFSSVHGELLCDLHVADQMVGICDAEYVQSDRLRQRLEDGRLKSLGSSMSIEAERVISVHPDALFVSPFENAGYGVLSTLGIPLIECADYMETSALGRAEWMKFYGLLMGNRKGADSLFSVVEKDYLELCELAKKARNNPTLMCDVKQGNAWYVPGGNSYIGRIFSDAGTRYVFSDRMENGSISLSFEQVYTQSKNADIWVVKYGRSVPYTYVTLVQDNPLYSEFAPWKNRQIYGCNTFEVPFYEEVPFHPNLLLKDMIKIAHPDLLPDYELKYYRPLAE